MTNRSCIAAFLFAAPALLPAAPATAADVAVADAKIAGGKLVVSGTTTPNTWVRLDGQTARDFNVKSGADGVFAFGVVYHPGDCIVDLQKLVSPTALGAATAALVADCGPAGVSPRGSWSPATAYVTNDLVTHLGSTWRARRGNANTLPASGAVWEQFAAAGAPAPEGSAGGAEDEVADADASSPRADTPIGPAGGDLTGNYPNPQIAAGVITSGHIAAGAVTLTKLADGAVTFTKLALDSVNTYRIIDGGVANADLANDSVNGAKVANESLTASDLASSSVDSSEIATDAVTASEIADNSIDGGEIIIDSLTASDLAASSVGTSELQDASISTADIANSAVTGAKVANNSLTTADIAGADVNGTIQVPAGYVLNGRCRQLDANVGGAAAGEAVIFSTKATLQDGIVIYGQRVPSNGHVTFNVCNFSGIAQAAIVDLPVRVVTFN